ncbi:MAG: oligopeptide:H+ symporter [Corynebacterium sp.]|nr:oligopeptide:H+ symporter [Corynebacterium sp.]
MGNTTNHATTAGVDTEHDTRFFGHPIGLANLFGVEIWERFSFYGMQAILIYYLYYQANEGGLGMDKATATAIIGAYGGFVYLACIAAGWVADRVLGSERTLLWSAILIMAGHVFLSTIHNYGGLSLALFCIAVGSGGVKVAATTVVGALYSASDARRDGGFSLYYMAINIGALFGPLLTGWVWGRYGFAPAFITAAIFMGIGVIQYIALRKKTLEGHFNYPEQRASIRLPLLGVIVVMVIAVVVFGFGILPVDSMSTVVSIVSFIAAVLLWFSMYRSHEVTPLERSRLLGYIPMWIATAVFFSLFQQQFTAVALYSDTRVNLHFLGVTMSPAWTQSINPIFVVIFSGIIGGIWTHLGERQPSTPVKFSISLILCGLSPFVFLPFVHSTATPYIVLVIVLLGFTLAELFLSPVGISFSTKISPAAFPARMVGLHYLSIALGTAMSGTLAGLYVPGDPHNEQMYFLLVGLVSIILGILMLIIKKPIAKALGNVR